MSRKLLLAALWLLPGTTALSGRPNGTTSPSSQLVPPEMEKKIQDLRAEWQVPGLSVSIVGSPNYTNTGEWASQIISSGVYDVDGSKVDDESLWSIASNSKFFTALALGMLINDKTTLPNGELLGYHTKAKDAIPGWQLMDPYAQDHVDLLDLLTMRSGLPRHEYAYSRGPLGSPLAQLPDFKPSAELRQYYQYSNIPYTLFPLIWDHTTNTTFFEYVQTRIFNPLGMTSATFNMTEAICRDVNKKKSKSKKVMGYARVGTNTTACAELAGKGKNWINDACLGKNEALGYWTEEPDFGSAGAGGIILDSRDMAKWVRELVSPQHIPPSVMSFALKSHTVSDSSYPFPEFSVDTYGTGIDIFTYRGHQLFSHSGGLPGQSTWLFWLPNKGVGVMIAGNEEIGGQAVLQAVSLTILDKLLGLDSIDWAKRFKDRTIQLLIGDSGGGDDNSNPVYTPPENPQPPIGSPKDILGKYEEKSYGTFDLKSLKDLDPKILQVFIELFPSTSSSPTQDPSSKNSSNSSQPGSAPDAPDPTQNIFVADLNKLFASHIFFIPIEGEVYSWITVKMYPRPKPHGKNQDKDDKTDKKDKYTPWGLQSGYTVIKAGKGIGMFGNFWGAGGDLPLRKVDLDNTEEKAEVWFKKS